MNWSKVQWNDGLKGKQAITDGPQKKGLCRLFRLFFSAQENNQPSLRTMFDVSSEPLLFWGTSCWLAIVVSVYTSPSHWRSKYYLQCTEEQPLISSSNRPFSKSGLFYKSTSVLSLNRNWIIWCGQCCSVDQCVLKNRWAHWKFRPVCIVHDCSK